MAFRRSVFFLLVLNVVFCYATVPVFLWGDLDGKAPKSNPLSTVTELEFESILERELKTDPFLAVFVDESLSVEDFSLKNVDGETVFPYLHANIGDAMYLSAVENPVESVHRIADPKKANFIKVTDKGLSADIETQDGGILFISLKDALDGETRTDLLRRHNDLMEDMFTKLQQKHDRVVALYTARYPSWIVPAHSRVRRQAVIASTTDYNLNGVLLYVSDLQLVVNNEVTNLTALSSSHSNFNDSTNEMTTEMAFGDTSLMLNFAQKAGYWSFDTVTVKTNTITQELYGTSEVYALMGWSYRCAQNVTFASYNSSSTNQATLVFRDMKVQPFFTETNGTLSFGESFNCVGFFSVPIWAGLFVTFILLAITFYGIMMMMDIRTMDRFDDPKGKTITINAGE